MALIVGGTTVTGTQVLDATKLSGNLPAINGSALTSLPSPSSIIYASQAVGCFAMIRYNDHGNFSWGADIGTNVRASSANNDAGTTSPGTWRGFGQTSAPFVASVGHRIS